MDKLEHNIKNAFVESDVNTTFSGKEAMWQRLDASMNKRKSVAVWWKVAAVFLGFILAGSVFANFKIRAKHQQQMAEMQMQNTRLKQAVDSLLVTSRQKIKTETKVVEKIVYRDRIVAQETDSKNDFWHKKYQKLQDSTAVSLALQKRMYQDELDKMNDDLVAAKSELLAMQNQEKQEQVTTTEPFRLKGEQVKMEVQKKPTIKPSEMKLKIFPQSFSENKNNLNKTLFNK